MSFEGVTNNSFQIVGLSFAVAFACITSVDKSFSGGVGGTETQVGIVFV